MMQTRTMSLLAVLLLGPATAAFPLERGRMAELRLTSTQASANPFDVSVRATFTLGSTAYTFWGFYAGGTTWRVRYNLPTAGTWTYRTVSSDAQLNGQTGAVAITEAGASFKGVLTRSGRALIWQNTGRPFYVMGQTAYALFHENVPWQTVFDWLRTNGFTLVRTDLNAGSFTDPHPMPDMWLWGGSPGRPDFTRFNLPQWNKIDTVLRDGLARGFVFELGTKVLQQMPDASANRTRYLRYLAARLGAYPHLLFLEDFETGTLRGGVSTNQTRLKSVGADFAAAFASYPRRPLLGVHTNRNDTYHEGSTGTTYYHPASTGRPLDLRGQSWLTLGTFHERWKMEGFGHLQHRPHFVKPMYTGEAVYEHTNKTVTHSIMRELDAFGMRQEITTNPRYYYRRYMYSVVLSGGVGVTYGLQGDSPYLDDLGNPIQRWGTGHPNSQDGRDGAEGYKDLRKAVNYFTAKGLNVNSLVPSDTKITNGLSTPSTHVLSEDLGLKRAKFASVSGQNAFYAYNPYHTDLTITGIPADLRIDILNPQTGQVYSGGQTTGGTFFPKPTPFVGDYLLHIRP
jgi:hypothetical protein